jgi:hypothetical protein
MDWYCALTHHLLNKNNIEVRDENESFESIQQQLEEKVIKLYKAILFYQMKSVCSYYKDQRLIFLQDLTNWNDWDSYLKSVTDAEDTLQKDSAQYYKEYVKTALGKLVELAGTWEAQLRAIHRDIPQAIQDQIDLQRNMYKDEKDRKYFEDLFIVYPEEEMKRIKKKKGRLLNNVYKWILDTEQYAAFTDWSDDKSDFSPCRLLWVKGLAGMGKTMLLIGIIRELSDRLAGLAPNLSYFFCLGTDNQAQNSATAILRSLVWMLLLQQPDLIEHLRLEHERMRKDSLFSDKYALDAISRVFNNMLSDPHLSEVYFIVDALDECDGGLGALVQLISTSLKLSKKVKWLVSSRPDVDVLAQLKKLDVKDLDKIGVVLDLNAQNLEGPVNAYIEYKLSSLMERDGYNEDILANVSDKIRRQADKTFLWVALAFEVLDEEDDYGNQVVDGWDAVETIKNIPPGLSELYDHMMTRIEKGSKDNRQRCKNVLVATVLALQLLSLSELEVLAGLPLGSSRTIVKKCGSFLTTKGGKVSLIHQSAKDYLENHQSRLQGWAIQGHTDIIKRSIGAMSTLYDLRRCGFESKDVTPLEQDSLAPIQYSCIFWLDHLRDAIKESPENSNQLCDLGFDFLKVHLLHWLESLSLLHKLSDGIISVRKLLNVVQVCL